MSLYENDFRYGVQFSKNGVTVTGDGPFLVCDNVHKPRKFGTIRAALSVAEKLAGLRRKEHNAFLKKHRKSRKRTFR